MSIPLFSLAKEAGRIKNVRKILQEMSPWKNFCGDKVRKSWGKGGENSHGKISVYLIASFLHGLWLLFATVASSFFLLIHRVYLIGSK